MGFTFLVYQFIQVVLEKRPLNACSGSSSSNFILDVRMALFPKEMETISREELTTQVHQKKRRTKQTRINSRHLFTY